MQRFLKIGAFAALFTFAHFQAGAIQSRSLPFRSEISTRFADSLVKTLPLRAKLAQLFVSFTNGDFYTPDDPSFKQLKKRVEKDGVGGIIFSTGSIYDQVMLVNRLQKAATIPLLISQDMEYGAAMRVRETTRLTPSMGIAATGNPQNAYIAGKITAAEARALGVHQIYAPVADINNNPENPIINVRSYSEDPKTVGEFASAFMKGVFSEGRIPTAKHFPGHGDTNIDSHVDMPVIKHEWNRLTSVELVPFRRLIAEGVPSVMSAHISFPNMSPDPGIPGTLDRNVLGALLRDSLHFDGVITTDAMTMEAITKRFSPGKAVLMALEAGSDIMLMSIDETSALDELERAVSSGQLKTERINQSVRKVIAWKHELGLFENRFTATDAIWDRISVKKNQLEANRIARESITLLRNTGNVIPVSPGKFPRLMVLTISDDESGTAGRTLARELRKYHPDVQSGLFDGRTSSEEQSSLLKKAERADLILVASNVFVRMEGKIGFSKEQSAFASELAMLKKPIAVISFGSPYILNEFPSADVHVCAWSTASEQVIQTVPGLFGAAAVSGKLPISMPGLYPFKAGISIPQTIIRPDEPELAGLNTHILDRTDDIIEKAIRDSVFPGAQFAVVRNGILVKNKAYGYHTYEKNFPVKTSDIYDLASLTKVMATTTAVMKLVDENKLGLKTGVSAFFPAFNSGTKKKITIQHLLEHTSGLPAFKAYGDEVSSKEQLLAAVLAEPLEEKPGIKMVYSDLGFILLGAIVEKVSGRNLDLYTTKEVFGPAGMNSTMFNPAKKGAVWFERSVPTEIDTVFRKKTMKGEVHDERAWKASGVSGHAGLFSNASDVAAWATMLLNGGAYAGSHFIKPETVKKFTVPPSRKSTRGLGFDLKSPSGSSAGLLLSSKTFGHTGFTGTSVWIDPEKNVAVILLSNRIHPSRSFGTSIGSIRASLADVVATAIEKP